jgi:uncharacterized membrane protein YjfL (UPF0719 family)
MENLLNMKDLVASLVFSLVGLVLFSLAFYIIDKLTPGNLWCEILEKQNRAAAIVVGALIIGLAIIIGLSIH